MPLSLYQKLKTKIAYRLLFHILLFSSFVTIMITATQLYIEYRRDIDEIDDQFSRVEKIFKKPLTEALWFFNENSLRLQLEGISNLRDIEYIELVGEEHINITIGQKISENTMQIQLPLIYTGGKKTRTIGKLTIVASMTGVYSRLFERLMTILITQSIKTFIVSSFIYLLFHFLIVRHISTIVQYLKQLDLEKKSPVLKLQRKSSHARDELDQTVASINEMATKLHQSYETINSELITRKAAEKELQKAHTELEQIVAQRTKSLQEERDRAQNYLDIAAVMMLAVNTNHEVILINKKGCDILGYDETEIIGKNWFDHFVPEYIRDQVQTNFSNLISNATESVKYHENPVVTKGGRERMIAWSNTTLRDDNNHIIGTLSSGQDITEKKLLEANLLQARKMESIGNLAGGIAHDFNNILSSILGFTELSLDDVQKGSDMEDNLQEVYTAGKRAKEIVSQMLAFARQSKEEMKPIQVDSIVREVLIFIRASIPATIEIKQDLQSDSKIWGNGTQVYQILMNLCTNAAHAMEDKGGILAISLQDVLIAPNSPMRQIGLSPGNHIQLTVSDTGKGMPPEVLRSIFEPYFTTKKPGEGTGMGLAVVHGIVESYGGKITVDSEPGRSTVFTVYLPITRIQNAQQINESEELPRGTENILLIDDEIPIVKMGSQLLNRLGYSVSTATDSIEALELFRTRPDDFQLVITDMTMPRLTGDQLASEMIAIRPDIPIILCTGYSRIMSDETARNIGIKAFAYKPIVKSYLAKTVRRVLDEVNVTAQKP